MSKLRATATAIALTAVLSAGTSVASAEELAYQPVMPQTSVTPYGTNVGTTTQNVANNLGTGARNVINGTTNLLNSTPGMTITPSPSITTPAPNANLRTYNTNYDGTVRTRSTTNGGMSWGWLGLLGLLGLAGIGGRSRDRERHHK
jgi:MYXO-CTERM domain-containing protein